MAAMGFGLENIPWYIFFNLNALRIMILVLIE